MASVNKVLILGNLVDAPKTSALRGGVSVTDVPVQPPEVEDDTPF